MMIKAFLLDLDNTLIENDDRAFAWAFLDALNRFGERHMGVADLGTAFRVGMKQLHISHPPHQTNQQTINGCIAQQTGLDALSVAEALSRFYRDEYPALNGYTAPRPQARQLIDHLRAEGYAVVIATNPIYPLDAILKRMEWGGLSANIEDYSFITNAENVHFVKPDPAYIAELIARIGVEIDEALMLGDRLENDIAMANAVGVHGFLLGRDGTLADFFGQVHDNKFDRQMRLPLQPAMIAPQYRGNVSALFGVIQDIKPAYWQQQPDPDEWSPVQIVCHLVESETQVQRHRLERILHEDAPFLVQPKSPPEPDRFDCRMRDGFQMALQWASLRDETRRFLDTLEPSDWQRPAVHSIFGPTTLLEMAQFTAQHDRLHIEQLCQTIGKCV